MIISKMEFHLLILPREGNGGVSNYENSGFDNSDLKPNTNTNMNINNGYRNGNTS